MDRLDGERSYCDSLYTFKRVTFRHLKKLTLFVRHDDNDLQLACRYTD